MEKHENNPDRDLCRYEFFEILVRIAILKYQDLHISPKEAFDKLLHEHVYKLQTSNAHNFRRSHVHTAEVNNVLKTNMPAIIQLFNMIKTGGKTVSLDKMMEFVG
jgi:hypothetical protein